MDDEASAKIFPTAPKNMKKQASCLGSKETVDEKGGGEGGEWRKSRVGRQWVKHTERRRDGDACVHACVRVYTLGTAC